MSNTTRIPDRWSGSIKTVIEMEEYSEELWNKIVDIMSQYDGVTFVC